MPSTKVTFYVDLIYCSCWSQNSLSTIVAYCCTGESRYYIIWSPCW